MLLLQKCQVFSCSNRLSRIDFTCPFEAIVTILHLKNLLEIPALRVFLGADAQLLGTSLAGAKMPLCMS